MGDVELVTRAVADQSGSAWGCVKCGVRTRASAQEAMGRCAVAAGGGCQVAWLSLVLFLHIECFFPTGFAVNGSSVFQTFRETYHGHRVYSLGVYVFSVCLLNCLIAVQGTLQIGV